MRSRQNLNRLSRKIHHQAALWAALPILIIIGSGLILQVKKEFIWIQPPTQMGSKYQLNLSPQQILESAKQAPNAAVQSWQDIERLDIRPAKGVVKVKAKNRWEIQIHMGTGEVLQEAYRRSDLIESIHDGSFFHDRVKLWIFLPVGIVLLGLWITGTFIFVNTILIRRNAKK